MVSVKSEYCYQGKMTIGACELDFKLLINNDLYEENYDELTGEFAVDVEMGLIRRIVNILVWIKEKPIDLTDEAYGFINVLLMSMKDRLEEMSSGRKDTQKTARFKGEWEFPPNIDEYLDSAIFPGVHVMVQ